MISNSNIVQKLVRKKWLHCSTEEANKKLNHNNPYEVVATINTISRIESHVPERLLPQKALSWLETNMKSSGNLRIDNREIHPQQLFTWAHMTIVYVIKIASNDFKFFLIFFPEKSNKWQNSQLRSVNDLGKWNFFCYLIENKQIKQSKTLVKKRRFRLNSMTTLGKMKSKIEIWFRFCEIFLVKMKKNVFIFNFNGKTLDWKKMFLENWS